MLHFSSLEDKKTHKVVHWNFSLVLATLDIQQSLGDGRDVPERRLLFDVRVNVKWYVLHGAPVWYLACLHEGFLGQGTVHQDLQGAEYGTCNGDDER